MPQSMLALAAIGILMFMTLQQKRHAILSQTEKIHIEITTMATQVGIDRLNEMRLLAFDEATKGDRNAELWELSNLLPLSSDPEFLFDSFPERLEAHSSRPDVADDDLDDYDAITYTISEMTLQDSVRFSIDSVVGYVQDTTSGTASAVPTRFKKVAIRVTALGIQPTASVTLSQLYSCGTRCVW